MGLINDLSSSKISGPFIHEFYIWLVFDNLLRALHTLQWNTRIEPGWLPPNEWLHRTEAEYRLWKKNANWHSAINPDIKLGNVVLAEPIPPYPCPTPKMMDLGNVHWTGPNEPHESVPQFVQNKDRFMGRGPIGTSYLEPPVCSTICTYCRQS